MALAYGITALASLCMVGVCAAADKKRDVWLVFVFVSVAICNLGYFMISVSPNLGSALNSNRLAYLGSVFLPCFVALCILPGVHSAACGRLLSITIIIINIVNFQIPVSINTIPARPKNALIIYKIITDCF